MAASQPTSTSYGELYSNPASNHFGIADEEVLRGYIIMASLWRATHDPLSVDALHQNILAEFSRPVVAIGVFVADDESRTGRLKLLHGLHSFPRAPGLARDWMVTMGFRGRSLGLTFALLHLTKPSWLSRTTCSCPGLSTEYSNCSARSPGGTC
jgi:hypothetical protein